MVSTIASTALNIFPGWLFVFPLQMGIAGAAIATGISQTVSLAIVIIHFLMKRGHLHFATKYAVEGLPDCLRMELGPFGIDVIVVEPGGIKTDWGIIAANNLKKTSSGGAYTEMANKAANGMIQNYSGNTLSEPELIAKTVRKAVTCRRPRTRYLIGFGAKPMVWTHKIFGDRVFDWVIKNFS